MISLYRLLFVALGIGVAANLAHAVQAAQIVAPPATGMTHSELKTTVRPDYFNAKSTRWSAGFGAPGLLFAQATRPIAPRHYMNLTLGYLPLMLAASELRNPMESRLNDRQNILVNPKAHALSAGIAHGYRLSRSFSVESGAALLVMNAGGSASLKNRETGDSTGIANVDITVFVPMANVNVVYAMYKTTGFQLDTGLGLNVLMARTIQTKVSGALPSFLDVAPEYRESVVDGRRAFEADLMDAIDRLPLQKTFLPSLFIRGTW